MFPENIVQATFQQVQTVYVNKSVKAYSMKNMSDVAAVDLPSAATNGTAWVVAESVKIVRELEYKQGMNVLGKRRLLRPCSHSDIVSVAGFIVFCIAIGIVISQLGEQSTLMVQFFVILDIVIMKLVGIVMW